MSTNEITTIFNHKEFGKVRVLMIDGESWFVGVDVAGCLGYKDLTGVIRKQLKSNYKKQMTYDEISTVLSGRAKEWGKVNSQGMTFINESGLYSLIMKSTLPKAEEFQDWVTSEVLPSIRKTGRYEIDKTKTGLDLIQEYRNMLDRWQEAEEQKLLIQQQHEEYKTYVKENKYDRYGKPNYDNKNFRTCAKDLGLKSAVELIKLLIEFKYGRRVKSDNNKFKPYKEYTDVKGGLGYFHCTEFYVAGYDKMKQWRITPKGYEHFAIRLFEDIDDDFDI